MMFPRLSRLNDTFVWKLSVLLGVIGFLLTLQAQQPAPQTTPPPKPAPAPQQKKANPFETVRESQPATPQAQPPKPQLETPKPAAEAAKPTGPIEDVIEAIEFRGSRRVPQDTLKALIFTKKGDPLDEDTLHRDFMALWNSARFDDIQLQKEPGATGWIIRFLLTERRVIRSIKYEGNKSLTVSEILDRFKERRVGLTVESQYDPNRIQRATNVLREYLSERGRQFATVEPEIRQIPPSSLEVVFKIVEGPKVKVGNISIEGNTVFNDRVVRRAMKNLKPIGVPKSILFENLFAKAYDATKLEEDKDRVRNFYQERGYFTARALEHRTEMREVGGGKFRFPLLYMNRPGKRIDIEVAFEEGRKYHLSKINFVGVKLFRTPDTLMRPLFQMGEGDIFSTAKLRKGLENMRKLYGQFGYIDFVPEPSFDIVPNSDKLELSLTVDEGKQFFVRRIDFSGNTTTRDKVIRREILIDEGDIYNTQLWEVSVLRLNQLGYFEVLKAEEAATLTRDTKTNTVDITLKVKERGKNSVQLNGGVSGIAGSFVGFGYSTNNFLGLGETLSINSQLGDRVRDVTFGFTEPYLFDRPIQAGFTVYMQRFNYDQAREVSLLSGRNLIPLYQSLGSENLLNYVSNGGGFTAYTSYQLRKLPFGRVGVSYGYNKQHIKTLTSASTNYFEFINFQGLNGPNSLSGITTSQVIPSFSYNTVDHPITPSRGKSIYLTSIFAGSFLQGNVNMIQPTLDMKYFRHGFAKGHVIGAHFLGRFVTGYGGRAAPPFNRFYMGGENDIRGFDIWGISPIAYIPSKAEIPILNSDGSARQQKIVTNGVESFVNVTKEIPTYQLIFPGGDTQGVTNFEYRIPIVGPVVLAGFFDAGINKVLRRGQLALNPDRLRTLNDEFPQSTFAQQAIIAPGTQKLRASAGVELQIMMPVVNAPFRLYWAYNPWIFQDFLIPPIAADRSYFPNNATFINSIATIGRPSPFFEKRSQFRFTISRTF